MNNNSINDTSYIKEDLPTWAEVYYDFYKGKIFTYNPKDESHNEEIDKYWKIPKRKFLISVVTNQFNKMLYEDGYMDNFVTFLHNNITENAISAMFACETTFPPNVMENVHSYDEYMRLYNEWSDRYINDFLKNNKVREKPPIYTLSMPSGNDNPFITPDNNTERIGVDDINGYMCIHPIIYMKLDDQPCLYYPTPFNPVQAVDWNKIIDWMMIPYINYFENGVGWKDEDGNLIDSIPDNHTNCVGAGFDPAL